MSEEEFDPETELVIPEYEELSYRRGLLNSRKTMQFNHGTIAFSEEKWTDFYNEWIKADPKDRLYRLIYCVDCGYFVGETSWKYNEKENAYDLTLLVSYDNREESYGSKALKMMEEEAVKNNIHSFLVHIGKDNPSQSFFLKREYRILCESEDSITLKKEF